MRTTFVLALVVAGVVGCGMDADGVEGGDSVAHLERQTVPVTFRGLSEGSSRQNSAPGTLATVENLVIRHGEPGAFEFVKRFGTQTKATATEASGFRMVSHGDSLIVQTLKGIYEYIPRTGTLGLGGSTTPGTLPPIMVTRNDAVIPVSSFGIISATASSIDMVMAGNVSVTAFIDNSGSLLTMVARDNTAGAVLRSESVAIGASNVKAVSMGGSAYVFYINSSDDLKCVKWTPSGAGITVTGPTTVIASAGLLVGGNYDVQANLSTVALLYRTAAGSFSRALMDSSLALTATVVANSTAGQQPTVGLCWLSQEDYANGFLYFATINGSSGVTFFKVSQTTLATISTTTGTTTAGISFTGYVSGGVGKLVVNKTASNVFDQRLTDGSDVHILRSVGLASRCFFIGGRPYVVALYNSASGAEAPQDTYFIVDLSSATGRVVGQALTREGGRLEAGHVVNVTEDSVTRALHFAAKRVISVQATGGAPTVLAYSTSDVSLLLGDVNGGGTLGAPLSFGGSVLFPGARVTEFDGAAADSTSSRLQFLHEQNFDFYPEPPVLTAHSGSGGSMEAGTYTYTATYWWMDANGQISESAPSTPVAVTLAASGSSVDVAVSALRTTNRSVGVNVYRTPHDEATQSTRIASLTSSPTSDTVTTTDTFADSAIVDNNTLYTDSGELENVSPPPFSILFEHQGRVVGVSSEEPHVAWISKPYVPGTSIGFSDALRIITPKATGGIVAGFSMDGHLVFLKRGAASVVSGAFPDNTGGGEMPEPVTIPIASGATSPHVVLTQLGAVFYSSDSGFWLMNRSLQTQFVGMDVSDTAPGNVVTSAALLLGDNQARFTTHDGTTFVLDLTFAERGTWAWMTFTGQDAEHAIVHGGSWYVLGPTGTLKQEIVDSWDDDGTTFVSKLGVNDIDFSGIAGFVRVWRGRLIGEWIDNHAVNITETPNPALGPAPAESFDYTAVDTATPAGQPGDPYELEFRPRLQKVRSMSVVITDFNNQNEGFAWTALAFELGVKTGLRRMRP